MRTVDELGNATGRFSLIAGKASRSDRRQSRSELSGPANGGRFGEQGRPMELTVAPTAGSAIASSRVRLCTRIRLLSNVESFHLSRG